MITTITETTDTTLDTIMDIIRTTITTTLRTIQIRTTIIITTITTQHIITETLVHQLLSIGTTIKTVIQHLFKMFQHQHIIGILQTLIMDIPVFATTIHTTQDKFVIKKASRVDKQ